MRTWILVLVAVLVIGLVALAVSVTSGTEGPDEVAATKPQAGSPSPAPAAEAPETTRPGAQSNQSPLERALSRARALLDEGTPQAEADARDLYDQILRQYDPDQRDARLALGYVDFQLDVLGRLLEPDEEVLPEVASNQRDYPFLQEVEALHGKRWLKGDEEVERAHEAVAAMREHARRLLEDHEYRLGDQTRANLAMDSQLSPYNYETLWSPPYLLCRTGKERVTEYDLHRADHPETIKAELRRMRQRHQEPLQRATHFYGQLYSEFLRRYGERHKLYPLSEPYGGCPDLGGFRSFADGVPLFVWIFEDRASFENYHAEVRGERIAPNCVGGYYRPHSGRIWLFDLPAESSGQERWTQSQLKLGVHQLLHWFVRQRNQWKSMPPAHDAFGEGLAGYLSSVTIGEDDTLEFTGWNADLLTNARSAATLSRDTGEGYRLFPLRELAKFRWKRDAVEYGASTWGVARSVAASLFRQQSWMFVHFLHHHADGKYLEQFHQLMEAQLTNTTGVGELAAVMEKVFGLDTGTKWATLQAEFHDYVLEELLPGKED